MHLKKNYLAITIFLLSLILTGCSASSLFGVKYFVADYDISLSSVERPLDATERYGEQLITNYDPVDSSKYKYLFEDGLVKILWLVTEKGFFFA